LYSSSSQPVRSILLHEDWGKDKQVVSRFESFTVQNVLISLWSGGNAVRDVLITLCTFGVLILLLKCLPLVASASFTVTACREKIGRKIWRILNLTDLKDTYSIQKGTELDKVKEQNLRRDRDCT